MNTSEYTSDIGTKLYASPEQMLSTNYGQTSDIYSYGLCLFRLFLPTYTYMQLIKNMQDLKKKENILGLSSSFPRVLKLLHALVDEDPSKRPKIEEIQRVLVKEELKISQKMKNSILEGMI